MLDPCLIHGLALNPQDEAKIAKVQLWMLADLRGTARVATMIIYTRRMHRHPSLCVCVRVDRHIMPGTGSG